METDHAPTRPPTSRKLRAEETRRKLLAAAVHHFSTRHFDDVAVTDIAETAQVAHGLVHHYFQNKRGAYLAALRDAAGHLETSFVQDDDTASPGERIRRLMHANLMFMAEHEHLALRLILVRSSGDPEAWEIFEEHRWRILSWFAELLEVDISNPALRLVLRSSVGAVDEAIIYWLQNGRGYDADTLIDGMIDMFIAGLMTATRFDPKLDVGRAIATFHSAQARPLADLQSSDPASPTVAPS
jgi:AcrR family transcriptional regulator